MDYQTAVNLVVDEYLNTTPAEHWETDPADANELRAEVLKHILNTLTLSDPAPPGAVTVTDYGDELSEAFRVVLQHEQNR